MFRGRHLPLQSLPEISRNYCPLFGGFSLLDCSLRTDLQYKGFHSPTQMRGAIFSYADSYCIPTPCRALIHVYVPTPCRAVDRIDDLLSKIVQYTEDVMVSVGVVPRPQCLVGRIMPERTKGGPFCRLKGRTKPFGTCSKFINGGRACRHLNGLSGD